MIYFFLVLFIVVLTLFYAPDSCLDENSQNRKLFVYLVSIPFFLLLLLRHDYVGTDTQNYRLIYDYFDSYVSSAKLEEHDISNELGFYSLVQFLNYLGLPFWVLKALSAGLYIGVLSYLIYRYSKNSWFSYIYFLLSGLFIFNTTMRHCFALSIFALAVDFAIRRKLIPYILMVLLAISFHSSAIVIIPTWWIVQLRLSKKYIIILSVIAILFGIFSDLIFSIGADLTGKDYEAIGAGGGLTAFLHICIVGLGIYLRDRLDKTDHVLVLFNIVILVLMPLAMKNPALFRIFIYFSFFNIILLANLGAALQDQLKVGFFICFLSLGVYSFVYKSNQAGIRTIPYVFYWEDYKSLNPDLPSGLN